MKIRGSPGKPLGHHLSVFLYETNIKVIIVIRCMNIECTMYLNIITILCRATYYNSISRATGGKQKRVEIAVYGPTLKSYIFVYTYIIGTTVCLKIY